MKKLYVFLYVFILLAVAVSATRYFSYDIEQDYTLICPECKLTVNCTSNSMYPTFDCKDTLIMVDPNGRKDINVDDVIYFRIKDGYRMHRVKYIKRACYITKGDANLFIDRDFMPCYYDVKYKLKGVIYE